jgi:phenol 2-monooxygenase
LNVSDLPEVLLPHKGKFSIQDYEKVFTDEASYGFGHGEIYKARGISKRGCVIVARPDQYVSAVLPLEEEAFAPLEEFLEGFMVAVEKRVNGQS